MRLKDLVRRLTLTVGEGTHSANASRFETDSNAVNAENQRLEIL
jgi:hypothetical protein